MRTWLWSVTWVREDGKQKQKIYRDESEARRWYSKIKARGFQCALCKHERTTPWQRIASIRINWLGKSAALISLIMAGALAGLCIALVREILLLIVGD